MSERREYSLLLQAPPQRQPPPTARDLYLRAPQRSDTYALAQLMMDAYRGTTDDEGESLEDAVSEVIAYISGERGGRALLEPSRVAFAGTELAGACLVSTCEVRRTALITYVMTGAKWKGAGVGRRLLWEVLQALREQDYPEARAVITAGNIASERLFRSMGFEALEAQ